MTDDLPALLLPAALVERDWIGADRQALAAASPGWAAIARRARVADGAGPDGPPPNDPGHERWLRARLGLGPQASLAACASIADVGAGAAWRIDPVHLHVGRDHLVLTAPGELALDAAESDALAAAIAPLFAEDGFALEAATPSRWYLRARAADRPLRLRTRPASGAIGRSIDAWMPSGEDARRWRRLVNEVQMTWHAHPVNERREAAGRPTVNSLWIDGPCPGEGSGVRLAAASALALRAGPVTEVAVGGAALVVDDRLLDAHLAGDPQAWAGAWAALDADTFGPIARAEDRWSRGACLVLAGDGGWRALDVPPRADWRFWRRGDPLALLADAADPRGSGGMAAPANAQSGARR
jgi:hypothetical protein